MSTDSNDRKLNVLGWLFHLGGLISLVLGAFVYHFAISALLTHQQGQHEAEIEQLELQLTTEPDTQQEFSRLQTELARLEASAEAARQRIPESPRESEFLAQISEAAHEKGLAIHNFTRGDVTVLPTHSQLQIRLSGEGDYASICGFFDKLATFSRVATVSEMNLSAPEDSAVYPLEMTLTLYFGARGPERDNNG